MHGIHSEKSKNEANLSALIIGNGESRNSLDLAQVSKNHITVGCNALHRDFITDHLICCDARMVREALANQETKNTKIYVRDSWYTTFRKIQKNKNICLLPELPYQGNLRPDNPIHWGSGSYAVLLSAKLSRQITMVGFDLYGNNGSVNNVYKGTINYDRESAPAVDHSYWIYQIAKVFDLFPENEFVIMNHRHWPVPIEWRKNNVRLVAL